MRNRFDEQLFELNREIIEMGAMCEESITCATKSLILSDINLANKVKRNSKLIDYCERKIERNCMKLLLQQQPVASDLRSISAALKIITDMERIGKQAKDIAEIATSMHQHPIKGMKIIVDIAQETTNMVTSCIDAFVKKDLILAEKVIAQDNVIDNYFFKVKNDIITMISEKSNDGEIVLDFLMISKYFERIGDHAVNIAEWVIYSITGTHKEV